MGVWELWFALLLLPSTFFIDCEVTLVKTTGREPYITPVCTNETLNTITVVSCKIRTERSRGEECLLSYKHGGEFFNGCDSRFTLMKKNQTISLHLTSLTPVDSGNYSCECANREGTTNLHLIITVEGPSTVLLLLPWLSKVRAAVDEMCQNSLTIYTQTLITIKQVTEDEEATSSTEMINITKYIGVIIFLLLLLIITGVILGFIHRKKRPRRQLESTTSLSNTEAEEIEPYSTFMQRENVLYSTILYSNY